MSRWPLLVAGGSAGKNIPVAWADEPAFTIKATPKPLRVLLEDGTVLRPTPRAFARLFGIPDRVPVPERLMLAQTVIGNGVPLPLAGVAAAGLLEEFDYPTGVSLFSGMGLWELGLDYVRWEGAVEVDPVIAGCYERAHGRAPLVADVREVDFTRWAGAHYLHASPVCKRFSVARAVALGGERDEDRETALAVVRAVDEIHPVVVTVENVPAYAASLSARLILEALEERGYEVEAFTLEAADYMVPHRRRRFILRATLDPKPLPPVPPPCAFRRSWWEAIHDLEMPEDPNGLAGWQIQRLIDAGIG